MYSGLPDLGKSPDFAWIYHGESTAVTRRMQMILWSLQSSRDVFLQSYRINISASYTDLLGSYSEEEVEKNEMRGRKCSLVSWLRYPYVFSCSVNCAYTLDSNIKTVFI